MEAQGDRSRRDEREVSSGVRRAAEGAGPPKRAGLPEGAGPPKRAGLPEGSDPPRTALRALAHDVRSLLNGALLRADLLEIEGDGLTQDQLGHVDRIRASVRQAVTRLDEALGDHPTR